MAGRRADTHLQAALLRSQRARRVHRGWPGCRLDSPGTWTHFQQGPHYRLGTLRVGSPALYSQQLEQSVIGACVLPRHWPELVNPAAI